MKDNSEKEVYELSGGGKVEVFKPFGTENYFAIVTQNGRYPEAGKVAKNVGRDEFSLILDGEFEYNVDGQVTKLKKDQSLLVKDGSKYWINGQGRILVFVRDEKNGRTEIE